jgi:uncharacterized membrane protein
LHGAVERVQKGLIRMTTRRLLLGLGLLGAGVGVARVATKRLTGVSSDTAVVDVKATITVNRSPEEVYWFWHDFENLPRFMTHLESVRVTGEGRSHWTAKGPGGRAVGWDAEIVDERPDELIAWRSLQGADVDNSGYVRFTAAPGGHGTEVRVELRYAPPGGPAGATIAKLLGSEPGQQVLDDLRRFKQVIETGEVVRSDALPEGESLARLPKQRPARPVAVERTAS